jgi:hypothetical protein
MKPIGSMKNLLVEERPFSFEEGSSGWCPRRKGGRRYQMEVLVEMCRKCRQKQRYCPEKVGRREKKNPKKGGEGSEKV